MPADGGGQSGEPTEQFVVARPGERLDERAFTGGVAAAGKADGAFERRRARTRSRARLAGWIMAYSRCSRVRAAVSPRRHQAAASCWRRRSRTPAASASSAARRSARVMAAHRTAMPPIEASERRSPRCSSRCPYRCRSSSDPPRSPGRPSSPGSRGRRSGPVPVPRSPPRPPTRGPSPRSAASPSAPAPDAPGRAPPTPIRAGKRALAVENVFHLQAFLQRRRHRNHGARAQVRQWRRDGSFLRAAPFAPASTAGRSERPGEGARGPVLPRPRRS